MSTLLVIGAVVVVVFLLVRGRRRPAPLPEAPLPPAPPVPPEVPGPPPEQPEDDGDGDGEAPAREPITAINVQPPHNVHEMDIILDSLEETGIRHIRVSWWAWSSKASWWWVEECRRMGVETLPLVYPHPDAPGHQQGESMAVRYRALFDSYGPFPYVQLGNEVDGDGHFGLTDGRDPYQQGLAWAQQMSIATTAIRRFDPAVQIVSAGVAWNRDGVPDFVRALSDVQKSIGGFDVLGIHTYGIHIHGEPLSRYKVVRQQGFTGPIWATEWGVSIAESDYVHRDLPPATDDLRWERADWWQEDNWRKVLSEDPSRFGYERLYGFQLTPAPPGWGIRRYPDWEPRPAYEWLKRRKAAGSPHR